MLARMLHLFRRRRPDPPRAAGVGFRAALPTHGDADPYRDPVEFPRHRSRFGGLWTDLSNAHELVAGRLALGRIDEAEQRDLESWIEKGFVVLPSAIPPDLIDRLDREIEGIWREGHPDAWVSAIEEGRGVTRPLERGDHQKADEPVKLLDVYAYRESARQVVFAPPIQHFLELVFERPPLAYQSLSFYRGSKQPIHRDTAFVRVSSPMEMVASWVALEDVEPGSGELEYYEASHTFEEFLFEGAYKWMPPGSTELGAYYDHIRSQAAARGIQPVRFRPRKGDVLIWSADLAHGGSAFNDASKTRRSLVTHYCPIDVYPMYFHYGRHAGPIPWGRRSYYAFAEKVPWRAG
jgi:phytanoyl-CoA hydroxylase